MSLYTYKYQLFVGKEETVKVDKVNLKKEADIVNLRNEVYRVNEVQFVGTGTARGNLRVYLPGTQPPFAEVGLDEELIIQKDFKSEDIDGKRWVVFAPEVVVPRGKKRPHEDEAEVNPLGPMLQAIVNEQYDVAWDIFYQVVQGFVGKTLEETSFQICIPFKSKTTWVGVGHKHLTKLLQAQCGKIDTNIQQIVEKELAEQKELAEPLGEDEEGEMREENEAIDFSSGVVDGASGAQAGTADYRSGRVLGIRLGSGCGKSHLLLDAPKLLKSKGLYITYNLNQSLELDVKHPRRALLLRFLLRMASIPHATCDDILTGNFGEALIAVGSRALRSFVVHALGKFAADHASVFVGVDEVSALETVGAGSVATVRQVVSELGVVATEYYKAATTGSCCHIFVTSLKQDPFYTASGVAVIIWKPEPPNEMAAEAILRHFLKGRSMGLLKPLLIASAGFHFRSMAFAAQAIGDFHTPHVQSIVERVYDKWAEKVSPDDISCIKSIVKAACQGKEAPRADRKDAEVYVDHTGAVPPALICGAFGIMTDQGSGKHVVDNTAPLYSLFNCEYAYTDDAKQLEQLGESYDLFRAAEKLPALSNKTNVTVKGAKSGRDRDWFHGLNYPDNLTLSTKSLFKVQNKETKGKGKGKGKSKGTEKETVLSDEGEKPSRQEYYSPSNSSHPLIDRAFIAKNGNGEECFVLMQDKVNDDVPKGVNGLNKAGDLLKKMHPGIEILCILNIIGAGDRTTEQGDLKYSFVLVRESELDTFYTVHFAPVAKFIRERHAKGYEVRKKAAQQQQG